MSITRRQFTIMSMASFAEVVLGPTPASASDASSGPVFWTAEGRLGRAIILGFGEAPDDSWLTPEIKDAFNKSSQLWLENADRQDQPAPDAAALQRMDALGRQTQGTLFDFLDPPTRDRLLDKMQELGIQRAAIEGLRPWNAYYTVMGAYYKLHPSPQPSLPDKTFAAMAKSAGKHIGYEMPTRESFVTFMAAMPDEAQREYIRWLLDFIDDQQQGRMDYGGPYAWTKGIQLPTRSLKRMIAMPALYSTMQTQRNRWWATKITELLNVPGDYFIAVGGLHVLGPGAIQIQLSALGIKVTRSS